MLQRLEKVVQTLGPSRSENTGGPSSRGDSQTDLRQPLGPTTILAGVSTQTGTETCSQESTAEIEGAIQGQGSEGKAPSVSSSHGKCHGKIIRDHGRDTYVRRWFWDDENGEVRNHMSSCLVFC